jgi:hypothetical protein
VEKHFCGLPIGRPSACLAGDHAARFVCAKIRDRESKLSSECAVSKLIIEKFQYRRPMTNTRAARQLYRRAVEKVQGRDQHADLIFA